MNLDQHLSFWLALSAPTGWMTQAACRTHTDLPWTADGFTHPRVTGVAARMRAVCDSCPVRRECEAYVDRAGVTGGFWAGSWRGLENVPTLGALPDGWEVA